MRCQVPSSARKIVWSLTYHRSASPTEGSYTSSNDPASTRPPAIRAHANQCGIACRSVNSTKMVGITQNLLFLHAHPDDEAIFTGGTIRRLADAGHRVVVVFATSG